MRALLALCFVLLAQPVAAASDAESNRQAAPGVHFTAGITPYVNKLTDLPEASTMYGLHLVAGAEWVFSPTYSLTSAAVIGGSSKPYFNNDWYEAGLELLFRVHWTDIISSGIGARASAVPYPVLRTDVDVTGAPPEGAYRSNWRAAVGPHLSLLSVRIGEFSEEWPLEAALWASLLFPQSPATGALFQAGISFIYTKI